MEGFGFFGHGFFGHGFFGHGFGFVHEESVTVFVAREKGGVSMDLIETEGSLDHERLDAYRVSRELVVLVTGFLKRSIPRDLRDQLDRASTSILFNIAEGAGKTSRSDKQRFYEIARGSATETAAQLDVLQIRGVIGSDEYKAARQLLLPIIQMLSRLAGSPRSR